jgi:hypothetical protein
MILLGEICIQYKNHDDLPKTSLTMYVGSATYTALKETGFSILIENMGDKKCR